MRQRLKLWAVAVRRDILALWMAIGNPRVPRLARILAALVAGYALSPIDLIPDFIPVLGYLDDLILVPLGIVLVIRLIPGPVMDALRSEAERRFAGMAPRVRAGAYGVVVVWIVFSAVLAWYIFGDNRSNP